VAIILEFEISEKLPVEWTKVFMGAVGLGVGSSYARIMPKQKGTDLANARIIPKPYQLVWHDTCIQPQPCKNRAKAERHRYCYCKNHAKLNTLALQESCQTLQVKCLIL